ncbi:putative bifunctional diguanylate cyclase/phosphodiesterase [uncultured Jatrophihabitans sp.]|uniref:putative bifunctional diguanylate cyclase/phosphodiesterase n=1 Tax=uncultured Jatrophihabitans sp. TaxID=1610747 RepID=UPI0035C9B1F9
MPINRQQFSLRRLSLSSVMWYACVGLGWTLMGWAVWHLATTPEFRLAPTFVTVAVLVPALEVLPVVQGRGHDPEGVVMSMAFAAAMLFLWGIWPVVLVVAVGSIAADLRVGKAWWKVLFNPAQYALAMGAAWLVLYAAGVTVSPAHPLANFHASYLWWMALAWLVYFVVNLVLVGAMVAGTSFITEFIRRDFWHSAVMNFAVLALSPLIVIVGQHWWSLIPLLLIPLLLVYYTAQQSLQREHAAGHDNLTHLPNRSTLNYELGQAFATHVREGSPFGLLLIDLDDFKAVNDTLGHQMGDELLVQFAERLRGSIRVGDIAARLGGDEFAVMVFDADSEQVYAVARRICDGVSGPVTLGGLTVEVDLSVGIAVGPGDATDPAALLRLADVAMYRAKAQRTVIEMYSPEHDDNTASRLGLVGDLRRAIDRDELELYYQPKLANDRTPMGVEALVRWEHPQRGRVSPDQFVPAAERSGIMPLLTAKVINLALSQIVAWRAQGINLPVAVNISPTDLYGADLPDLIARELAARRLPADVLQLEITERVATHHLEQSRATLDRLRAMGVLISLDDFGTGYSSLLRLGALPVDEIKIDRIFVSRLDEDVRAFDILATLVGLAHALGVPAIAEGVETQDQLHLVEKVGCDGVQGWYIAKPMPSELATEWIRGRLASSPLPAPQATATPHDRSVETSALVLSQPLGQAR